MNIERIKSVGLGLTEPKGKFQKLSFTRRPVGDKDILIEIYYAGICHSDIHTAREEWGKWNDNQLVTGHEICGLVKQVGKDVTKFKIGDFAAIGCMVDSCGECPNCKAGHEQYCTEGTVLTYDSPDWKHHDEITKGGYSTNYVLNEDFAIKIPKSAANKLPQIPSLCCAGITTYAPIASANVKGKKVAIIGVGGLGHMGIQIANSFGAEEVVGFDIVNKAEYEDELHFKFVMANDRNIKRYNQYFDFILSTVPFDYDLDKYMGMVKKGGEVAIVGLPEYEANQTNISIKDLILNYGNVKIWGSQIGGIPLTQECVDYCLQHKCLPIVEVIPPDPKALDEAYEKVRAGKVRFRYVIDMTKMDGVEKFKDGGKTEEKVDKAAEKIAELMETVIKPAAEAGNPTALRLMNLDENYYTFTDEDVVNGFKGDAGQKGNVYVSSVDNYLVPGIQYNKEGQLYFIGGDPDYRNNPELFNQAIKFATPEDAQFFGEHYHDYPELIPMLQNPIYKEKQGGTLDMTLEDILKLDISDYAKNELTRAFQQGGGVEKKPAKVLRPTDTITVGDKEYDVEIADTEEKRKDGLSRVKSLDEDEGMLFVFEDPTTVSFTMAETSVDLDICFIDEEGEVIEVHSVDGGDPSPVECSEEYVYVLEVAKDSGIQPGDGIGMEGDELSDEEKETAKRSKMLVLDENGDVQMKLQGGERIMSIISTRKLIKLAIKAYKDDNDAAYRRVGKFVMNEFNNQDNRDPQYVEAPEKKGEENGK